MKRDVIKGIFFGAAVVSWMTIVASCALFGSEQEKARESYRLGQKAVEAGKDAEAVIHFKNALKKDPSLAKVRLELAHCYLRQRQVDFALRELTTASGQSETFQEASRLLAELHIQLGNYSKAIPYLEGLLAKGASDLQHYIMLGECLLTVRRTKEAAESLEKAEALYPNNAFPKVHLARVLLFEGKRDEAEKKISEALELEPKNMEIRLIAANFHERAGDMEGAEKAYRQVADEFSKEALAWISLARFYHRKRDSAAAEVSVRRAIELGIKDPSLFHILGITLHIKKDFDGALEAFRLAAERFPDDWKSLLLLGDYYLVLKRVSEAREIYERTAEKWPQLLPVKSKMAELLIAERQYDKAKERVEAILKQDAKYVRARILRGMLLMTEGRLSEAREDFLRAQDLIPRSPDPRFLYGMTFLEEGRYDVSLSELMEALEADPASLNIRIALAYVYLKTGRPGAAIDELTRVLETQPGNEQALMLRAQAYAVTKQLELAQRDLARVVELRPDLPLPRIRLAETYMAAGKAAMAADILGAVSSSDTRIMELTIRAFVADKRFDDALSLCDRLEKEKPGQSVSLLRAGVLLKKGEFAQAEALLKELMGRYPSSLSPYLVLGRAYLNKGEKELAIETYNKALLLEPRNTDALAGKARSLYLAGRVNEAIAAYEEVMAINDGLAPAANDLAYIYAEAEKNLDRALELATRAKEMQPHNPDILDTMGWVQFRKGLYAHAEKNLRDALAKRPGEALFHHHMGFVCYKTGRYAEALTFFNEALRLGMDTAETQTARAMVDRIQITDAELNKARLHEERGESSQAIKIYESILKESFHWKAAAALASLYADAGENLDRALQLARQVSEALPDDPAAAGVLGWVLLKKGSRQTAGRHLHRAVIGNPDDPVSRYRLGIYHYEVKNLADSQRELEQALGTGLDKRYAEKARHILEEIRRQEAED
jgi:tetratricopeptide (TPR) repeat protein